MDQTYQLKLALLRKAAVAADAVVKSHKPGTVPSATPDQMKLAKTYMVMAVPGFILHLFEEVDRLTAELEAARIDQEIAHFARDTTVMLELASALDPFLEPIAGKFEDPSTADEWYGTMKLMLDAAKASGLWPIKPEPELTDEAQDDRDAFESMRDELGGCRCHLNPPCSYCTHPGNPVNQEEDPSCWKVLP